MRKLACVILTACVFTTAAVSQTAPDQAGAQTGAARGRGANPPGVRTNPGEALHASAQAAGSLALHLCTGYFSTEAPRQLIADMARTVAQATAPITARTEVDEVTKVVSVYYADHMPPRIAVARSILGCTQLPIGATKQTATALSRPSLVRPNLDGEAWPLGDRNAAGPLTAERTSAVQRILEEVFKDEQGIYGGVTWGVAIVKDGKIVAERYAHGMGPHLSARTNSMCKSVGVTLMGVGVRKGLVDLHRKAPLMAWRRPGDPRGDITIDDLLHMTSGLYTEGAANPNPDTYQSGAAVLETSAFSVLNTKPGTRFVYAGADPVLAVRALHEAMTDDGAFQTFPHRELLWKIGMTRTLLEVDWNDDFIVSGQCWSTVRDFGRLGLLYLADGVWNGERLLPAAWNSYVSTPTHPQPIAPSIGGDAGYGAQFWLHGGLEGLPRDAYAAFGARGQYAMIIPSENLVIVRRGFDGRAFSISKFSADVVSALK